MQYSSTITRSGQITLPKPLRDLLSVKPGQRIAFTAHEGEVTIKREKTLDEIFADFDAIRKKHTTPEIAAKIKRDAGKTAHELMDEYWDSPEGQQELHRINYGY